MKLLEKIGAAAGAVEEASLEHILTAWNSSSETDNAVLLQSALLDLVTQLTSASPELGLAVEAVSVHMINCCMAGEGGRDTAFPCPSAAIQPKTDAFAFGAADAAALPLDVGEHVCKLWAAAMHAQPGDTGGMRPALEVRHRLLPCVFHCLRG